MISLRPARPRRPSPHHALLLCRGGLATLLIFLLATTACLPVVSPPANVTLGTGLARGVKPTRPDDNKDSVTETMFGLELGFHPLQYLYVYLEDDLEPKFDAGIGFILEVSLEDSDPLLTGGYLEGNWAFWQEGNLRDGMTRAYVVGEGQVLVLNRAQKDINGFGASFGVGIELLSFMADEIGTNNASNNTTQENQGKYQGVAWGALGIGLEVVGNIRLVGNQRYNAVSLNLVLRLPATAGLIYY